MKLPLLATVLSTLYGVTRAVDPSWSFCATGLNSNPSFTSGNVDCSDGEIMLRSDFIEVGIHNLGSFGTVHTPDVSFEAATRLDVSGRPALRRTLVTTSFPAILMRGGLLSGLRVELSLHGLIKG
jgi:hypothetical protein